MTDDFVKLLDEKIADASANIASCERMGFPHAAWSQQVIVCEALRTAYLAYREKLVKELEGLLAFVDDEGQECREAIDREDAIKILKGE